MQKEVVTRKIETTDWNQYLFLNELRTKLGEDGAITHKDLLALELDGEGSPEDLEKEIDTLLKKKSNP